MNDHPFTKEEITKLEEEMKSKVLQHFSGQKDILDYLEFTLNNFSYRYLESETTGNLKVDWHLENSSGRGRLEVVALEPQLSQSLKTKNVQTRKGIIEMAKTSKKSDGAKVRYILGVSWDSLEEDDIEILAYAEVNWDFPEYSKSKDKHNRLEKRFNYSDPFEMRNNFPRELEDICEVF